MFSSQGVLLWQEAQPQHECLNTPRRWRELRCQMTENGGLAHCIHRVSQATSFVCFDSFGMFLKLENRVLSLHNSEEDVGSCGILVPRGLEHGPCWTTVWLGPWRRKEPSRLPLSHPSKALSAGTTSRAPPWRFGSEVGWESWQSEFSRSLGVIGKVLEPGSDLSSFVCFETGPQIGKP